MRRQRDVVPLTATTETLPDSPEAALSTRWHRLLLGILLAGAVVVPVIISRGDDHFRLPKQLTMYAVAIAAISVAGMALVLHPSLLDRAARRELRIPSLIAAAGVIWAIISTLASLNRALSIDAMIWGVSLTAVLLIAAFAFRPARLPVVATAILLPAVVNATLLLLQATRIWNPWVFTADDFFRARKNAFLGNVDDVGVYLAATALFAIALSLTAARRRIVYAAIAALLTAALLATETLTAIGAFAVALLVLLFIHNRRMGVIAMLVVPVVAASALLLGPTRARMSYIARSVEEGRWGAVVSGRLLPFGTAVEMFEDRPVTGVGPGVFKFEYMRYSVMMRERAPRFFALSNTQPVNFAEVHNDHLQLLAEMGFPAYLIVLAGITFIGFASVRSRGRGERAALVRIFAAPMAVFMLTVMIAQFPLELAATAFTFALLGAACLAWTEYDVA